MTKIIQRAKGEYLEDGSWSRSNTIIECCGEELECGGFTNTCPICNADYNWSGARLAPREQWGEETGESLEDILSIL
jgi:hypothetical protein